MKALVLGANGLCGTSLVPMLTRLHDDLELLLVDPSEEAVPPIIRAAPKIEELYHVLPSLGLKRGDVLIDLAPELPKLDVMQAADDLGISVINATCCEHQRGTLTLVDLLDEKLLLGRYNWQVGHIPCAGMNPGNIDALLGALIGKHGQPSDITEWEMDSTLPFNWDGEGFATWSPAEFASEFADESTWECDGRSILFADGPPIANLRKMPNGQIGALCQHEEILKWAWQHQCKARYIYGYSPKAMQAISKNIEAGLDLALCRKLQNRQPTGGDLIGLDVKFESSVVRAAISTENENPAIPIGSNATSYLVACGIASAMAMLRQGLASGLHWPDTFGQQWIDYLTQNALCDIKSEEKIILVPSGEGE